MTTPETCVPAEPSAFALLSAADADALMTTHRNRLAQIAAVAESAVDAAITEHFAERDRLEAAAHEALLARLTEQRLALRRLEAELDAPTGAAQPLAAAPRSVTHSAIRSAPWKRPHAQEPAMIETPTTLSNARKPARNGGRATGDALQAGAAAVTADEDTAVAGIVDAEARHRAAETVYLASTAGRRTDHAAALSALAEVEARIAALRASGLSARATQCGAGGAAPADIGRSV